MSRSEISFLSLAPDQRNYIYELVYAHHKRTTKTITLSSEKGYQEVPPAISRTCRQIRDETLAYFFDLSVIIFVLRNHQDLAACRDWVKFTPSAAWKLVRGVRVKPTHQGHRANRACSLQFDLALDSAEIPVSFSGDRLDDCGICYDSQQRDDCVPIVDLVLKDMCAGGMITAIGVGMGLDLLEPLVV